MEFLYILLILPIESVISLFLTASYSLTSNYGLAIIFTSIVVNVFLIPIYYQANKWKEADSLIQQRMKPEIEKIKKSYKGQEKHFYIQTIHRRYQYSPLSSIKASMGFLLQIPFFFAAFHLLSNYPEFAEQSFFILNDLSKPDALFFGINAMPFIMTFISLISAYIYTQGLQSKDKYQLWGMAIFFLVLLYNEASGLLLYWTMNNIFYFVKSYLEKNKLGRNIFQRFSLLLAPITSKLSYQKQDAPALIAFIALMVIVLFVNPISLYHATTDFTLDLKEYLIGNYHMFVVFLIAYYVVYKLIGIRAGRLLGALVVACLLSAIVYSFLISSSFGDMDLFIFDDPDVLETTRPQRAFGIVSILLSLCLSYVFLKKQGKLIKYISLMAIFSSLMFVVVNKGEDISVYNEVDFVYDELYEEELSNTLSFSKDKNIVVLFLDGFNASLISKQLAENKDFLQGFDGFTWFKNTLTTGTTTGSSYMALAGGHNYTVEAINSRSIDSIAAETDKAYRVYPDAFTKEGWKIIYADPQYGNNFSEDVYLTRFDYANHFLNSRPWYENFKQKLEFLITQNEATILTSIAIFKATPPILKKKIYNGGRWLSSETGSEVNKYRLMQYKAKPWGLLDSLATDSNLSSDKNMFKYLHFDLPHPGNAVDSDGDLLGSTDYETESLQSLYKITEFLNKLKELEIYDNTMVILISDHGWARTGEVGFTYDFSKYIPLGSHKKMQPSVAHALFMVKDFGAQGEIIISNKLMSNADLAGIVCDQLAEGCAIDDINYMDSIEDRTLIISTVNRYNFQSKNKFVVEDMYQVRDNIFDHENWKKIK